VIWFLSFNEQIIKIWSQVNTINGFSFDPFGVIATSIVAIFTIYLAWKANQIGKNALEQNRPILKISENKDDGTNQFLLKQLFTSVETEL